MRFITPLLTATFALPAYAADLTIDDIAPPDSILIARVNDWPAMIEALEATPMWEQGERDEVREWLTDMWEGEMFEELREEFAQLDIDPGEMPMPAGDLGIAVWNANEESFIPGMIAMADFGDRAEEIYDLLVEQAELDEEDGAITVEFDEEAGYKIMSTRTVFDEEAAREESLRNIRESRERFAEDGDDEFWDQMEQDILEQDFEGYTAESHTFRADDFLFTSSDRDKLSDAITALEGEDIDSIAGDDALESLRARVRGAHADVVIVPSAVDMFFDEMNNAAGGFVPGNILSAMGIDQIQGIAAALRFDAPDAQAEVTFAMPLAGEEGVFSLIEPIDEFSPPAFIPANAASEAVFAVDWSAIIPFAREVILTLPQEQRAQVEGQFAAFTFAAAPILDSLGPQVHFVSAVERPIGAASQKNLYAIQVANEAVISGAIAQYGQMMGLQAREFLGNQIFEAPPMIGMPLAVGLTTGWAFIGSPEEVENAMRRLAAEAPDSLASTKPFKRAAERADRDGIVYAFADLIAYYEFQQWVARNPEDYFRAMMTEEWMDDELIGYLVEDLEANPLMAFLKDAPDIDSFEDATGPMIQELHLRNGAVEGRVLMLRPEGD